MTQKQLAALLNIAPSTVGNYIQKSREPDFSTLKRIADIFHVTVDYLLDHRGTFTESREEEEMIQLFRSLTAEQQHIYLEQGKAFLHHNSQE
jgi:transcriptional regulator with XRE-family HTH domain